RVLDRALVAGLTSEQIWDYKRTRRIVWQRITRDADYGLAYALQIVARIGEIWDLLGNQDGGWHRHHHDEEAYQGYRQLLLRGLNQPESTVLHALVDQLLPRILPPEADDSGALIRADMPNRIERLRSEIIALAVEQGDPISIDPSTHGDLDETFEEESWAWGELKSAVSRVSQAQYPGPDPPVPTTLHRNGRPRIKVTYEQVSTLYWQMFEDLGDKLPTKKELCERLKYNGTPIGERTLQKRIAEWLDEGHQWPPPAEMAEGNAA
ncbi:MAG: hypothetical protein WBA46_15485, partial [Thermomicrobiales bacterium]